MVIKSLQILAIVANLIVVATELIFSILALKKSVAAKRIKRELSYDDFSGYTEVFSVAKIMAPVGIIFQILSWLMFSSGQRGFAELSHFSWIFAISYATLCFLVIIFGIVFKALGHKDIFSRHVRVKANWYIFHAILYFILSFILGG